MPTPNCVRVGPHLDEILSPMVWKQSDTLPWTGDGECTRRPDHKKKLARQQVIERREEAAALELLDTRQQLAADAITIRNLSAREKVILALIADAKPQAVIATDLGISQALLVAQMTRIRDLIGLRSISGIRDWSRMRLDLLLHLGGPDVDGRGRRGTGRGDLSSVRPGF